jgi:hypothetical protein
VCLHSLSLTHVSYPRTPDQVAHGVPLVISVAHASHGHLGVNQVGQSFTFAAGELVAVRFAEVDGGRGAAEDGEAWPENIVLRWADVGGLRIRVPIVSI